MTERAPQTWQGIVEVVSQRIESRVWAPGDLIPNEADLARDFGCSRSTVNRALRALAERGVLERKRKAGTRVRDMPESQARLEIPVIRQQIERRGSTYGYRLLRRVAEVPPPDIARQFGLQTARSLLHVECLHCADGRGFIVEDRWINPGAVPSVSDADFTRSGANEWLVRNVPFTTGKITLRAEAAQAPEAQHLDCAPGTPVFVLRRVTRHTGGTITWVRMTHAPGYRMQLSL